jgi:hypothetical protein
MEVSTDANVTPVYQSPNVRKTQQRNSLHEVEPEVERV